MSVKNSVFIDNSAPQCDAAFLNSVRAEINNLISNVGEVTDATNLNQLGIAAAIMAAGSDFYTDTGAADAYVLSAVGSKSVPIAYFVGMRVRFIITNTNTGASTVNVAGLGVKNIKSYDGSSTPAAGDFVVNHELQLTYNGTNFVVAGGVPYSIGIIPVGAMMPFAGTTAPTGWLLCYGQAISRTTYANLFALTSTAYGIGDGSTTFNLPDYRGRVHIGLDNMGGSSANRVTSVNADSLNNTGAGLETTTSTGTVATSGDTTLSVSQIPALTYTPQGGNVNNATTTAFAKGNVADTPQSLSTGLLATNAGGGSHNHTGGAFTGNAILSTPPWIAGGMIIKY